MSGIFPVISLAVVLLNAQFSSLLMGKAQFCDRIAPLRAALAPGMTFSPEQYSVSGLRNVWYKVPDWFAGTWHKQSETVNYRYTVATKLVDRSEKTVDAAGDEKLGWQRDRAGELWEYDCNYVQHSHTGTDQTYHFVERCEPVASESEKLTFEIQSLDIRVHRKTNQILSVERSISTEKLSLIDYDHMKVESVRRAFKANGEMVSELHSTCVKERVAEFAPVDEYRKKDMKALFRRYLISIGRLDLIPNNCQATSEASLP